MMLISNYLCFWLTLWCEDVEGYFHSWPPTPKDDASLGSVTIAIQHNPVQVEHLVSVARVRSDPLHVDYLRRPTEEELSDCFLVDENCRLVVGMQVRKNGWKVVRDLCDYLTVSLDPWNNHDDSKLTEIANHPCVEFISSTSPPSSSGNILNGARPRPTKHSALLSNNTDNRFTSRETIAQAHDLDLAYYTAPSQSIGVFEYQNNQGVNAAGYDTYRRMNGLPQRNLSFVNPNGGTDTETQLDIGCAGGNLFDLKNLTVWTVQGWILEGQLDRRANPQVVLDTVGHSWGWNIFRQADIVKINGTMNSDLRYVARVNLEFMRQTLWGTTNCISSGDSGFPGRCHLNCSGAASIFPGASEWVLAVGAVSIQKSSTAPLLNSTALCRQYGCASGNVFRSCDSESVGWCAGGGTAGGGTDGPTIPDEACPPWQYDSAQAYWAASSSSTNNNASSSLFPNTSNYNPNGRVLPDVVSIGHAAPVWMGQGGDPESVDGTSMSAPIMASLVAVLNEHWNRLVGRNLGHATPFFYLMDSTCEGAFTDVVLGNNHCTENQVCPNSMGFEAIAGFDAVTGLGLPKLNNLVRCMERLAPFVLQNSKN